MTSYCQLTSNQYLRTEDIDIKLWTSQEIWIFTWPYFAIVPAALDDAAGADEVLDVGLELVDSAGSAPPVYTSGPGIV